MDLLNKKKRSSGLYRYGRSARSYSSRKREKCEPEGKLEERTGRARQSPLQPISSYKKLLSGVVRVSACNLKKIRSRKTKDQSMIKRIFLSTHKTKGEKGEHFFLSGKSKEKKKPQTEKCWWRGRTGIR